MAEIEARDLAEQTLDGTLPYEESWRENAENVVRLAKALDHIAELGEPMGQSAALRQCAWLKSVARSALDGR